MYYNALCMEVQYVQPSISPNPSVKQTNKCTRQGPHAEKCTEQCLLRTERQISKEVDHGSAGISANARN